MIDHIVIENFKSLRHVDLKLGQLNLLVGANGSGRSNLLDALRVLSCVGPLPGRAVERRHPCVLAIRLSHARDPLLQGLDGKPLP